MKLDPEVPLLSPCLLFNFLSQVNLVNSEAVFLVNKAAEQFVQCLALEVIHLLGFHFQVLCDDFIREGFKNPRHGNFPLGGYPPGASTDKIFPKS